MGYRSDVSINILKKDYEDLKAKVENASDIVKSLFKYATKRIGNEQVVLTFSGVKWYDGYEDVDFFTSYIDELNEKEHPYKYIILGEDTDDIQIEEGLDEEGNYICDAIYVIREIGYEI